MKSIVSFKNSLININKTTFPKHSSYLHCKNFSLFQRQTSSLHFYASQITNTFTEKHTQDHKLTFNSIEEIHINNNTYIEHDEIPSDLINPFDKLDNTENKDNIQIELKGRNSKSPKRANHGARPCSSVMRRLKSRAYFRKPKVKY